MGDVRVRGHALNVDIAIARGATTENKPAYARALQVPSHCSVVMAGVAGTAAKRSVGVQLDHPPAWTQVHVPCTAAGAIRSAWNAFCFTRSNCQEFGKEIRYYLKERRLSSPLVRW